MAEIIAPTPLNTTHAELVFAAHDPPYELSDSDLLIHLNADELYTLKDNNLIELASHTTPDGEAIWRWVGPHNLK